MADARTTLGGQGIAVGGGYGSNVRGGPSPHDRVVAQRAEANGREQEARRLGTWKEGVGVMSKQQLAGEARDKALFNQNIAAQNNRLGINQSETPQISATDFVPANRINVPAANARGQAEMARQMAADGGVGEQGSMPPTVATPLEGVVKIAPQYRVKGESPFGYAGTPEYKEGQMVRATSSPITRDGRQTGIQGASNNNWQQAVVNKYNDIGIAGTQMNRAYVQAVKAQTGEFDPMKLAESIFKQAPAKTERTDELYQVDRATGERRSSPPPMFFSERENFVPSSIAADSASQPLAPKPIVSTQEPDRRNWFDKLMPSDEKIKQFEQKYDAQRSLGGQIVEALANPMAWYYSNQNKEINADIEAGNTPQAKRALESKLRAEAEQRKPEIKRMREAREAQAQAAAASQRAKK